MPAARGYLRAFATIRPLHSIYPCSHRILGWLLPFEDEDGCTIAATSTVIALDQDQFGTPEETTACNIRSTQDSKSPSIACCHSRTTRHPMDRNLRKFFLSRARFLAILVFQKSASLFSHSGKRYPCQKSPSIKTATRAFLRTMSGLPGRALAWIRNLRPRLSNALRTNFSIPVSRFFTLDIQ